MHPATKRCHIIDHVVLRTNQRMLCTVIVNSDNRTTHRLRVAFNSPLYVLTRYMMRTLEFTRRFLRLEFWLRLIVEALTPVFICVNSAHVPVRV